MKKTIYGLCALLLILIVSACSADEENTENDQAADRSIPVEVAEVTKKDLVVKNTVYGRTQANATTPIMLDAPGELDSIERKEGEEVQKNDALFVVKTPAGKQTIRAPKDGTLINFGARVGESLSTEEPLAYIADLQTLHVSFSVTSEDQKLFENGDELDAHYQDEKEKLTITSIGTIPDDTGLYPVKGWIENDEENILAGEIVEVIVPVKRVKDALQVPTTAIVEEAGDTFIYIAKKDKAKKLSVEVVETQSEQTAVKADLQKGDDVIINGQLTLTDGSKINVVDESGE